jgi:hypothetical protein
MTDDFVKQLREKAFRAETCEMLEMAADRIEKLEAALKKIAQHDMQAIAMDALRPGERIREKDND